MVLLETFNVELVALANPALLLLLLLVTLELVTVRLVRVMLIAPPALTPEFPEIVSFVRMTVVNATLVPAMFNMPPFVVAELF